MSSFKKFFLFSFGGLVFLASGFLYPAFAYEIQDLDQPVTGGFVLGPGKAEVWADPGDEKTREIYITNRLGRTMNFKVEIEDFRGSRNPEETVVLLGQDRGPYSLKDYLKPEITEFSLMHGQRIYLPVKIQIPPDAEPGGLYGAVIVTTNNPKSELESEKEKATGQVQMVSRLGSLFFVRVSGDAKEDGLLKDFYIKNNQKFFEKTPVNFEILFENNGSIHLIPYATIEIQNMFGKKIDEIEVDPWFVLPDSLRLREIEWNKAPLFGKYTATIGVNRGYDDIVDQKSISFWVIPWKYVLAGLAGLLLLALLLRWIFSRFEIRRKS